MFKRSLQRTAGHLDPNPKGRRITSRRPSQVLRPAVVALVVGLSYTTYFIGWSRLGVTNTAWLENGYDRAQAYLGWAFLRLDPVWHFPPTFTEWLGWPFGVSIGYTDSIPLVAVIARLLSPILPANFQYFGLWILVCFALAAYLGFRLCTLITKAFNFAGFFGGLLLLLAPSANFQALGHPALTSHFVILLSLLLYFKSYPNDSWQRSALPQIGTVALATSIHPYLAVMTSVISAAFFCRCALERRCTWLMGALSLAAVAAGAAVTLVVCGYFVGDNLANYNSDTGYRYLSFNLLSPFNSLGMSLFVPPFPTPTAERPAGLNYLGLGIFFLLMANARSLLTGLPRLFRTDLVSITLASLALTVLAASTLVTVGPYTLVDLQLPDRITNILAVFRVSARLFWPVGYLIMAGAIYFTCRNYRIGVATALLAIAAVLQFLDDVPLRVEAQRQFDNPRPSQLTSEAWKALAATSAKLLVVPAWQCGQETAGGMRDTASGEQTPGGLRGFAIFGVFAVKQGLKTNDIYQARPAPAAVDFYCRGLPEMVRHGELDTDAAYVFGDRFVVDLALAGTALHRSHYCARVDGFNLCRPRQTSDPVSGWRQWPDWIPTIPDDGELRVGDANWRDGALLGGWSVREDDHVWNTGASELVFRLTPAQQAGGERVELTLAAMLERGSQGYAIANNADFTTEGVTASTAPFSVTVPLAASADGFVRLRLNAKAPVAPQGQGLSPDTQPRGLNLMAVRLLR